MEIVFWRRHNIKTRNLFRFNQFTQQILSTPRKGTLMNKRQGLHHLATVKRVMTTELSLYFLDFKMSLLFWFQWELNTIPPPEMCQGKVLRMKEMQHRWQTMSCSKWQGGCSQVGTGNAVQWSKASLLTIKKRSFTRKTSTSACPVLQTRPGSNPSVSGRPAETPVRAN